MKMIRVTCDVCNQDIRDEFYKIKFSIESGCFVADKIGSIEPSVIQKDVCKKCFNDNKSSMKLFI